MTIKELMTELKEYPEDALVVMSSDEEGNSKSPLDGLSSAVYVAGDYGTSKTYVGRTLTSELEAQGYTEEDIFGYKEDDDSPEEDGQDAVVLWPVN